MGTRVRNDRIFGSCLNCSSWLGIFAILSIRRVGILTAGQVAQTNVLSINNLETHEPDGDGSHARRSLDKFIRNHTVGLC
jgi:hypothetical protein